MDETDVEKFESMCNTSDMNGTLSQQSPDQDSPFRRNLHYKRASSCKEHGCRSYFTTKNYNDLDPSMKNLAQQIGLSKSFTFARYDRKRPHLKTPKTPYTLKKTTIKPFSVLQPSLISFYFTGTFYVFPLQFILCKCKKCYHLLTSCQSFTNDIFMSFLE